MGLLGCAAGTPFDPREGYSFWGADCAAFVVAREVSRASENDDGYYLLGQARPRTTHCSGQALIYFSIT
jgi:hypothetical protein